MQIGEEVLDFGAIISGFSNRIPVKTAEGHQSMSRPLSLLTNNQSAAVSTTSLAELLISKVDLLH